MNKAKEISALWKQIKPQIGELARLCHEIEDHYEVTADAYQRGYEAGLKDAWEAARKISMSKNDGGLSWESMNDIFGTDIPRKIYKTFAASEAIEKIRQYEQEKEQEEIKVGDEVTAEEGTSKFVVTWMSDRCICGVDEEGKCYSYEPKEISGRTGRRFPEIAEVLREIREEET